MRLEKGLLFILFILLISPIAVASDDAPPALPSEYWGNVTMDELQAENGLEVIGTFNGIVYGNMSGGTISGYYDLILTNGDKSLTYNEDRNCAAHYAAGQACVLCVNESDCIEGPEDGNTILIKVNGTTSLTSLSWLNGSNTNKNLTVFTKDKKCDGIDEDVDSQIDEDYAGVSCGTGVCAGATICISGKVICSTNGTDAGTCALCNESGETIYDGNQDLDCSVYDCDPLDTICTNYNDVNYCKGVNNCANANGDCNNITYSSTATLCNSSWLCSGSPAGDNMYNALNYKIPSQGYCDGAGSCDHSLTTPVCDLAEGTAKERIGDGICVDGQTACVDTCSDGIDNDADGFIDINDVYCANLLDQNKFYIKNSAENNTSWFGDFGDVVLKGTLQQNSAYAATSGDEFRFQDRNGDDIMVIDKESGNMYIKGSLFENQSVLIPPESSNDVVFLNESDDVVIYLNESGYLFLKGILLENGNP